MMALALLVLTPMVLFGGYLFFRQDALIFRPRSAGDRSPADLGVPFENLTLGETFNEQIHAWWIPGPPDGKAIIYFYGTDSSLTHELSTLRFLLSLGVSVLMVDYPGYGR